MVADTDPLIGQVLEGKYRIDARLGRGGMGTVYRAVHLAIDLEVAVKVMRVSEEIGHTKRDQLVERFRREARATSQLKDPHTIRVFDFGETAEGLLFIVLELLDGETLRDVIQRDGPMTSERVSQIAEQLCFGLGEAHAKGIVHRDLKPDNIMLCAFGARADHVKILDFGIAHLANATTLTEDGMTVGTLHYMAPEQIEGGEVTPRTDLYAMGCLLYEMLEGVPPYDADTKRQILVAHLKAPPPRLTREDLGPHVRDAWNTLLLRLMAKNPEARHESAAELASQLASLGQLGHVRPSSADGDADDLAGSASRLYADTITTGHSIRAERPEPAPVPRGDGSADESPPSPLFGIQATVKAPSGVGPPGPSFDDMPETDPRSNEHPGERGRSVQQLQGNRDESLVTGPTKSRMLPRTMSATIAWTRKNGLRTTKWLVVITVATSVVIVFTQWGWRSALDADDVLPLAVDSRRDLTAAYLALNLPVPPKNCQANEDRVLDVIARAARSINDGVPSKTLQILEQSEHQQLAKNAPEYRLMVALAQCRTAGGCGSLEGPHRGILSSEEAKAAITAAMAALDEKLCPDDLASQIVQGMVFEAANAIDHRGADLGGRARRAYREVLESDALTGQLALEAALLLNLARLNVSDEPRKTREYVTRLLDLKTAHAESLGSLSVADALYYRARAGLGLGDWPACEADARAAIAEAPTVPRHHWQLGRCLEKLERKAGRWWCKQQAPENACGRCRIDADCGAMKESCWNERPPLCPENQRAAEVFCRALEQSGEGSDQPLDDWMRASAIKGCRSR